MPRPLIAVVLASVALFGLTACGGDSPATDTTHLETDTSDSAEDAQFTNCLNWVIDNHPEASDEVKIQACVKMIDNDPHAFER